MANLIGVNPPQDTLGVDGDFYREVQWGIIYEKSGGTWSTLSKLSMSPTIVEQSAMASGVVSGNANANGVTLNITSNQADGNWTFSSNEYTFTGSPKKVTIHASTYFEDAQAPIRERVAPMLHLERDGIVLDISATAYQRQTNGHIRSSNSISFVDNAPGVNPSYKLRAQRGSSKTNVVNVDKGSIALNAVTEKIILAS